MPGMMMSTRATSKRPLVKRLERGAAVGGLLDAPALGLEPMAQDEADGRVVVGNQCANRLRLGRAAEGLFGFSHRTPW